MLLWLIFGLITAAALALLLRPLVKGPGEIRARAAYDAEVFRAQFAELDRDTERGTLEQSAVEAARTEVARRMLAADTELSEGKRTATGDQPKDGTGRRGRLVAVALALIIPAATIGIYAGIGSPGLPDQPLAGRRTAGIEPTVVTRIEAAVVTLNKRIAANPKDYAALDRLGRAYFALRRYNDAATAFDRARALRPGIGSLSTSYGEALVMAAGSVGPLARAAFTDALKADPGDVRARFYLGVAKSEDDDAKGALAIWLALEAEASASTQWRERLVRFIEATAKRVGIAPAALAKLRAEAAAKVAKKTAAGPQKKPGAGASEGPPQMSPAERQKLIGGMVARLAARLKQNPDDLAGWRRLGRSYLVLGEPSKSVEAYGRAAALAPKNVAVLVDFGQALLAEHGKDRDLPPRFVDLMRRINGLDPRNAVALWFLGLAEHEAGNAAKASALWERLLARLPESSRERAALAKRIEMLKIKPK